MQPFACYASRIYLCSMGLFVGGFSHSKLHRSCPWRGSCSLPCCGGFIWGNKESHICYGRLQFVIRPMSVQHRFFMGILPPTLAAGTHVTCRLPCHKAPYRRHNLLKVTKFWNTMSSARLPVHLLILFNNSVESWQKGR